MYLRIYLYLQYLLLAFHHGSIISSPDVYKVSGTQSECDALEHQFSDLRRTSLKHEQLQVGNVGSLYGT